MKKKVLTERELLAKKNGEIFTPLKVVNIMLDKLPNEVWEPDSTFCDPSAGNGNFLIEIFKRKIALGHSYLVALQTIWGVELMEDNVQEMKERFLELIPESLHEESKKILDHNLICHDAFTWNFEEWKEKIDDKKTNNSSRKKKEKQMKKADIAKEIQNIGKALPYVDPKLLQWLNDLKGPDISEQLEMKLNELINLEGDNNKS